MSLSIREQLVEAVVTALQAAGGPAGLAVHRSRARPLQADQLPACVVFLVEQETRIAGASDSLVARHTLTLRVESRVTGDPPDELLDPLTSWVVQRLCLDRRWGGLATNTVEAKTTWAAAEEDQTYGAAAQDFLIEYVTLAGDPTSQG